MHIVDEIKGNLILFPEVLFSFSVGTMRKINRVCRKQSLRIFCICHLKISSDGQGGELRGVKDTAFYTIVTSSLNMKPEVATCSVCWIASRGYGQTTQGIVFTDLTSVLQKQNKTAN